MRSAGPRTRGAADDRADRDDRRRGASSSASSSPGTARIVPDAHERVRRRDQDQVRAAMACERLGRRLGVPRCRGSGLRGRRRRAGGARSSPGTSSQPSSVAQLGAHRCRRSSAAACAATPSAAASSASTSVSRAPPRMRFERTSWVAMSRSPRREPGRLPVPLEHLARRPGLVPHAPARDLVGQAG